MKVSRARLARMFREWFNDYLTVQVYADAYGITRERMFRIINLGRIAHNRGF